MRRKEPTRLTPHAQARRKRMRLTSPIIPTCKESANKPEQFRGVNILVNNAGVTRDMLSMAMSPEDWDVVLNTNLKGAFNFVQAVQRSMIKQRHGRILLTLARSSACECDRP